MRSSIEIFARTDDETALLPETDSLYIELNSAPGAETREVAEGVNVDLDAAGMWSASISTGPRVASI